MRGPPTGPRRWQVNIHEYQAKELLKSYGVPVPRGVGVNPHRAAARVA